MTITLIKTPPRLSLKKKKDLIQACCKRWQVNDPDPRCELVYHTPYQLLISVVLSAQTTDKMVNRAMSAQYKKNFTPQTVSKLGEEKIYQIIKSIGLAKTKAKHITKLTELLIKNHKSQIPRTREALEALPGVGRKTANVILGEIYREPTLAVDTHVFRVAFRLGLHREKTPLKAEHILLKIVPTTYLPTAHHWFILHGRYTCKALTPDCNNCLLNDICPSFLGSR